MNISNLLGSFKGEQSVSQSVSSNSNSNSNVFLFPLQYTIYQKKLIDILVTLHKKHLIFSLNTHDEPAEDGKMSDSSMYEAFVYNIKQITNHPTLLVDHYIPKDLLLLNPKENVINLSQKYYCVNEIIDRLVSQKKKKTIILSVSNSKEMDIIESILIGKSGIEYYRFSGASLYYDDHGSFNFHGKSEAPNVKSESPSKTRGRRPGPGRGRGRGRRGGRGSSTVSFTRGSRRSVDIDDSPNSDGSVTGSNGNKLLHEDYTVKISKNNPEYQSKIKDDTSKPIKVYLILPNQLKYLTQFKELRSDLIISLCSNYTELETINVVGDVPILKPLVVNSLEYFEWKIRESSNGDIEEEEINKKISLLAISKLADIEIFTPNMPNWYSTENITLRLDSALSKLMQWIKNGEKSSEYPFKKYFDTVSKLTVTEEVTNLVKSYLETQSSQCLKPAVAEFEHYKYFELPPKESVSEHNSNENTTLKQEGSDEITHGGNHIDKRPKKNPYFNLENLPTYPTYREYQSFLTCYIDESQRALKHWIDDTSELLKSIHLSETKRQAAIDSGNVEIGELFKKDRDLDVLIEARKKIRDRMSTEYDKTYNSLTKGDNETLNDIVSESNFGVQDRYEILEKIEDIALDKFAADVENDIAELSKSILSINDEISKQSEINENVRQEYQKMSTNAAELSAYLKQLTDQSLELEKKSKNNFVELQVCSIKEKTEWTEDQTRILEKENLFLEGFLNLLEGERNRMQKEVGSAHPSRGRR